MGGVYVKTRKGIHGIKPTSSNNENGPLKIYLAIKNSENRARRKIDHRGRYQLNFISSQLCGKLQAIYNLPNKLRVANYCKGGGEVAYAQFNLGTNSEP